MQAVTCERLTIPRRVLVIGDFIFVEVKWFMVGVSAPSHADKLHLPQSQHVEFLSKTVNGYNHAVGLDSVVIRSVKLPGLIRLTASDTR